MGNCQIQYASLVPSTASYVRTNGNLAKLFNEQTCSSTALQSLTEARHVRSKSTTRKKSIVSQEHCLVEHLLIDVVKALFHRRHRRRFSLACKSSHVNTCDALIVKVVHHVSRTNAWRQCKYSARQTNDPFSVSTRYGPSDQERRVLWCKRVKHHYAGLCFSNVTYHVGH